MKNLATGLRPAVDITMAEDPFIQQLRDENDRLRDEKAALERRLKVFETVFRKIKSRVQESQRTPSWPKGRLADLRTAVDQIVAKIDPQDFPGSAINWGDLGCKAAYIGADEDGHVLHLVVIDEAAPGESEFCRHVAEQLAACGWPDVEVSTKW